MTTAHQRRMLFELADSLLEFTDLGRSGYRGAAARLRQDKILARAEADLGELPPAARRAIEDCVDPAAATMLDRSIAGLGAASGEETQAGLRAVLTALAARLLAADRREQAQRAQTALASLHGARPVPAPRASRDPQAGKPPRRAAPTRKPGRATVSGGEPGQSSQEAGA